MEHSSIDSFLDEPRSIDSFLDEPVVQASDDNISSFLDEPVSPISANNIDTFLDEPPVTGQESKTLDAFKAAASINPLSLLSEMPVSQAAGAIGTGLVGAAAGGIKGVYDLATGKSLSEASESAKNIQTSLTVQPKTEAGKAVLEAVSYPFEKLAELATYLGGETVDATGSPVLATAVDVGINIAPFILGPKIIKGKSLKQSGKPKLPAGDEPTGLAIDLKMTIPKEKGAIRQFGERLVDVTGGKAITPVRKLGDTSTSFKKIADTMESPEITNVPVPASFFERTSMRTGEFMVQFEDALQPLIKRLTGKVPKETQRELRSGLRGEKVSKELTPVVKDLRVLLNDFRGYANKAGMDVGFIENYFPRLYNKKYISTKEGGAGLSGVYAKHGINNPENIIKKIINEEGVLDIGSGPVARVDPLKPEISLIIERAKTKPTGGKTKGTRAVNLELSRKLKDIPDSELAPYLVDDFFSTMEKYIEGGVRRAEWVRDFGKDGIKLNNLVRKGIKESNAAGKSPSTGDISRIYNIADAMQLKLNTFDYQISKAANSFVGAYQLIRTLPLATLSSLSEPLVVLMRGNASSAIKAIPATLNHVARQTVRSVDKKFPKAEATRAIEESGLGLDVALVERLTASFGGEVTKATSAFFKLIFLQQWTRFNRVWGFETGKIMTINHLKAFERGGAKGLEAMFAPKQVMRRYERELIELGIDIDKGIGWVKRGANKADPFFKEIQTGGVRFTNEVVMAPRATVRPMWHSNPHMHLISQLKGFQTTFGNTVVKRMFREMTKRGAYENTRNAIKFSTITSLMVLTAILSNEFREYLKYGEKGNPKFKNESDKQKMLRAIDRAGFTGVAQVGIDATLAYRFGSSGAAQILGPTVSQASEIAEGIGEVIEDVREDKTPDFRKLKYEAVNAIPGANVIPSARRNLLEAMGVKQ